MPPNCMAGMSVPTMAKNIAAIWLLVMADANKPIPVAIKQNSSAESVRVKKLPVMGTAKTVTASKTIKK